MDDMVQDDDHDDSDQDAKEKRRFNDGDADDGRSLEYVCALGSIQ